ncbi:type VI secretion system baseplate subunit TssG [Bosea sp. R86505]|uniref:type VI secretion system baseplate subunit TssG n=1 Tax=Bosea sp. R86505 TaxID=3101710 RepID=UPI0036729C18
MAAANGDDERDLSRIEPLDAAAIQFYELCLRLEEMFPQPGGIGATGVPSRETVRFRANPTLGFPAEEVAAVRLPQDPGDPVVVVANLLGLHGPASPLPPAFTERIIFAEDSGALKDFSDFFNHRLLALLFRVWKHYRHHSRYVPGASDAISAAVTALFGMYGASADEARPARALLLPYAGTLALYSHSAPIVAGVIRHYFGIPCTIEEFVPREIIIPPEDRFTLGVAHGELGIGTICGENMRDVMGKFRIRLGPLTAAQCASLLPGETAHETLQELVRLSIREPCDWDHAYVLAPGEAAPARLGDWRLGWSGWLDPDPASEIEFVI